MAVLHSATGGLARGRGLVAVASAATVLGTVVVLGTIVAFANRGFDLTDEAYYILSMQEPAAYRMTSSLFGYALRPAYLLLGGSITGLRIFGVLAIGLFLRSRPVPRVPATVLVAAGAALPAMYYGFWLPTPSYNWLVLAAALLLLPAIVLLADRERGPSLPAALAALAGLIAAMAKPPAAGAFAALYLAATVLLLREPRRIGVQLAFAFGFTAAGVAALAALLPLETVWAQTRGYVEMHGAAPPAGRGAIADLLVFLVHPRGSPFVAALIAAGLAARVERSGWSERTRRRIAGLALAAIAAATALIVGFPVYTALGPGMAAIAFAAVALGLLGGADRRAALALALAALLPLAAAIGTTNDTVSQTSLYAGVLGLVALLAAMAARRNGAVAVVALCLVLVTGAALWKGLAKPYRLAAPIWRQTEPVEIGTRGERLKLDPRAAALCGRSGTAPCAGASAAAIRSSTSRANCPGSQCSSAAARRACPGCLAAILSPSASPAGSSPGSIRRREAVPGSSLPRAASPFRQRSSPRSASISPAPTTLPSTAATRAMARRCASTDRAPRPVCPADGEPMSDLRGLT